MNRFDDAPAESTWGDGNGGANGNGHGPGDSRHAWGGGVAVAPAPHRQQRQAAAPQEERDATAPATSAGRPVGSLQELLVRRMPLWKRAIDFVGAAFGLLLLSPLFMTVAAAIKLTSPGPVVFKQRRAGLGGRPFTIYKFRTMCVDAEAKKKALRALSEQDGPAFKLTHDPRVTRIGRILRKTSIDELPQLWNVLKGDMSLVGPRPLPVDESEGCEQWQKRRLDVTPGLTCIWQIKGRSEVTFAEWVRMDVDVHAPPHDLPRPVDPPADDPGRAAAARGEVRGRSGAVGMWGCGDVGPGVPLASGGARIDWVIYGCDFSSRAGARPAGGGAFHARRTSLGQDRSIPR